MDNLLMISLVLGRIMGVSFAIWGFSLLLKRKECVEILVKLQENPSMLYLIAFAMLPVGLIIVILHPIWVMDWRIIITITGYLIIFSSLVYLFFSNKVIIQLIEYFNKPISYILNGVLSLVIGLYLIVMSFGMEIF